VFPSDDFDNGIIAPTWELAPVAGLSFSEEGGVLKLTGVPEETGFACFLTLSAAQRQNVVIEMDFKSPTGLQSDPNYIYRIQFDPFNYIQIQVGNDGYRLIRVIANEVDAFGVSLSLFGDETTNFHRLKLSYDDAIGHVEAFVDNVPLGGIYDKTFSAFFVNFQFASYTFVVEGQYIEREFDNFRVSGPRQAPKAYASKAQDGLVLTWTSPPGEVHHYEVYRSVLPYFASGSPPDRLGSDIPSPESSYTDAGAFVPSLRNYFYVIRAVGTDNVPYPDSNRVGTFNFALEPGTTLDGTTRFIYLVCLCR
jgi:hypothetical protein